MYMQIRAHNFIRVSNFHFDDLMCVLTPPLEPPKANPFMPILLNMYIEDSHWYIKSQENILLKITGFHSYSLQNP